MASEVFEPELRLHPSSWLFAAVALIRQMIVPVIAAVFLGARNDGALWGLALLIPIAAAAVWRQRLYRYGFGPQGLVIHRGLLFRNARQIDYRRIENIDLERGPLHRLLGVAEVRVETSTGGKPEALIRVLSLDAYQEMRDRVFAHSGRAASEAQRDSDAEEAVLLHLPPSELVRYGLIDNRGMVVVLAAFGVLQQMGLYQSFEERLWPLFETLASNALPALGLGWQIVLGVATLILLVAVMRMLSVALALVTLHDFTLTERGRDFGVRYGALTRIDLTLRVARIQTVRRTEGPLHRRFGRVSLRVDLAGGTGGEGEDGRAARVRWLAPLCTPARAAELIQAALPHVDLGTEPDWQPLSRRARGRMFRRTFAIWTAILAIPAIWLTGFWAPLLLLVVPGVAWLNAHLYVKHTRWALSADTAHLMQGWLVRRLVVAPRSRVQAVVLTRSPFDRRLDMATVAVDTAGAARRQSIRIPYLDAPVARDLAERLYRTASP